MVIIMVQYILECCSHFLFSLKQHLFDHVSTEISFTHWASTTAVVNLLIFRWLRCLRSVSLAPGDITFSEIIFVDGDFDQKHDESCEPSNWVFSRVNVGFSGRAAKLSKTLCDDDHEYVSIVEIEFCACFNLISFNFFQLQVPGYMVFGTGQPTKEWEIR